MTTLNPLFCPAEFDAAELIKAIRAYATSALAFGQSLLPAYEKAPTYGAFKLFLEDHFPQWCADPDFVRDAIAYALEVRDSGEGSGL